MNLKQVGADAIRPYLFQIQKTPNFSVKTNPSPEMKYNFPNHHRRSVRLKGYNYAKAGSYFVTLTSKDRFPLFGEIVKGKMNLNDFGIIASNEWLHTPEIRPNISLGVFVVMPDHIHGIIIIREEMHNSKTKNQTEPRRGVLHTPLLHTPHTHTPHTPKTDSTITKNEFKSGRGVLHTPLLHTPHTHTPHTPTMNSTLTKNEFESGKGGCNTPLPDSNSALRSPSQTLGAIIRGYMGSVTKQINALRNTPGQKIWQRNYHDHIIRNKWSFKGITQYILMNPKNWEKENNKGRNFER